MSLVEQMVLASCRWPLVRRCQTHCQARSELREELVIEVVRHQRHAGRSGCRWVREVWPAPLMLLAAGLVWRWYEFRETTGAVHAAVARAVAARVAGVVFDSLDHTVVVPVRPAALLALAFARLRSHARSLLMEAIVAVGAWGPGLARCNPGLGQHVVASVGVTAVAVAPVGVQLEATRLEVNFEDLGDDGCSAGVRRKDLG